MKAKPKQLHSINCICWLYGDDDCIINGNNISVTHMSGMKKYTKTTTTTTTTTTEKKVLGNMKLSHEEKYEREISFPLN